MPLVTFEPSGETIEVKAGTELLTAARQAGVSIDSPCGGKGTCGKCMVRIISGQVDTDSIGVLSQSSLADGFVLACKSKLKDVDVCVEVPEQIGRAFGQFTDSAEDASLVHPELLPKNWQYEPLAVKWLLEIPMPQIEDGLSDIDRVTNCIRKDWGDKQILYELAVIRKVADAIRDKNGIVTVTLVREQDRFHVVDIVPGDTTAKSYGIAVDIGTTTVAVQLVFLPLAKVIATRNDYNAQVDCGLDVISRINYAKRPERLEELRQRVLKTVNSLIEQVVKSYGIAPEEICNAVISANTTMVHLLLGLKPEYIRLSPYTPTVLNVPFLSAAEIGLNINPLSWVYISPAVGSYVGGDITAGLLCTDLAADSSEISLFIDIGTNGEVAIGNNEFLMTCACSAGPAFEGGGIKYGMRASRGAIERVNVDPESGVCTYQTIGGTKPKGICGSGMIALLADLFLTGWIDAAGKLNRKKPSTAISFDGRNGIYTIVPAQQSDSGEAIVVSELDIDNIIRAKAAIYSACALMLNQVGLDFNALSKIYIAGGFGRFLDLDKAKVIGLVPDLPLEKYHYIGNSSLMGSYMVLVSNEFRDKQLEIAARMTYIELSTDPSYMDQYTGALFLPHTSPQAFPTVMAKLEKKGL